MAWEFHKVEVAWASQPDAVSPIWTDETSRVDPDTDIVITRGRQTEVDTIEPSTLSLAFNNADHRFTPGNPYSPLYPNVKPARKIRVSETIDGITYWLFTGYILFPDIEAWAQAAPGSRFNQTITVTAVDRLGRLDQAPAIRGNLYAYIAANQLTDLVAWYPLDESTQVWKDALGVQPALTAPQANIAFNDTITAGAPPVAYADDGASLQFAPGLDTTSFTIPTPARFATPPAVVFPTPISTSSGSISVSYWAVRTADVGGGGGAIVVRTTTNDSTHTLTMSPGENLSGTGGYFGLDCELFDGTNGYNAGTVQLGTSTSPGVPYFVTLRLTTPSLLFEVWLNDEIIQSVTLTKIFGAGTITTVAFDRILVGESNFDGRLSHLQVRNGVAWAFADHSAQFQAGKAGLLRQTPGQRIATVLGYAGVTVADLALDAGTSVMVQPSLAGQLATAAARAAAAADVGELFTSGDGKIVFHARNRRYNAPIAATIDLSWLSGQWRQRVQPPINAATITVGNGVSATTTNAASQQEYGQYSYTGTTDLQSAVDADAANLGAWLTTFFAAPRVRAPAMTIDLLAKSNTVRHTVLGREISDRIAMSGLPVNAPEGIGSQFIEGVQHQISPLRRKVTFNTSPLVGYLPGTAPAWPTVAAAQVADQFGRTTATGWTTADTGQTYVLNQASTSYAVSGGLGLIGPATANTLYGASITGVGPDVDATVFFLPRLVAVGAQLEQRLRVRDNGSTYYETLVQYQTDGTISLYLQCGVATVLSAIAGALAYGAGTTVGVRLQVVGSTIRHKIWDASTTEPATWAASVTDTTYAGAATDSLDLAADRITGNTQTGWAAAFEGLSAVNMGSAALVDTATLIPH